AHPTAVTATHDLPAYSCELHGSPRAPRSFPTRRSSDLRRHTDHIRTFLGDLYRSVPKRGGACSLPFSGNGRNHRGRGQARATVHSLTHALSPWKAVSSKPMASCHSSGSTRMKWFFSRFSRNGT